MIDFHSQLAIIPKVYETAHLQDNLEHSGGISISWKSADDTEIPLGAYITYPAKNEESGIWKAQEIWRNDRTWKVSQIVSVRYILLDPYAPTRQGIYYKYEPTFKHPQALLDRTPFWIRSMDAEQKPIDLRTTSFTGKPHTIAKKLVDFMAEYANETLDDFFAETVGLEKVDDEWVSTWSVNIPEPSVGVDTAAIISVPFNKCSIKGAADAIANAMGCNVYWDWSTKTIRFIAGTTIQGDTYNCFHVLGGTTNMGKVTPSGSYASVTQCLTLRNPQKVENGEIVPAEREEITINNETYYLLKGSIISKAQSGIRLTNDLQFDEIYPKMELYIKTARERVCRLTDENGNFIVDHYELNGQVVSMGTEGAVEVLKKFSKWYVTFAVSKEGDDPSQWEDYNFDQGKLINDKPLAMLFQIDYKNPENMSSLVGRQYELTYYPKNDVGYDLYDKNDDVATSAHPFHLEGGEFYIAFEAVGERILPTTSEESVDMYPVVGKKVTLVNVALTQEKSRAQDELLEAAKEVIALMQTPSGQYNETVVFAEKVNGTQPKDTIAPVMIGGESPFDKTKHGPVVTGLNLNLDTNIAEVTVGSWTRKTKTGGMSDKVDAVTITVNSSTVGGDPYGDGSIGEGGGYTPQGSGNGSTETSTMNQTQPKPDTLFMASLGNTIDVVSCLENGKVKQDTDIYTKINCYYGTADITEVCNIRLSSALPSGITAFLETSSSAVSDNRIRTDQAEAMSQNHYWLRIHVAKDTDLSSGKFEVSLIANHPYHGDRGLAMVVNAMIPGASSVRIDLDNDADYVSLDSMGKVRFARTITVNACIYDGSKKAITGVAKHSTLTEELLKIGNVTPQVSEVVNGVVTITWNFAAGDAVAATHKTIELDYTKNGETLTYSAVFSFGALNTDAVYQLSPSLTAIAFERKDDNTLDESAKELGLKLVKFDGTSTTDLNKCPSGYSVKYVFNNSVDSINDGTAWPIDSSNDDVFKKLSVANSNLSVSIALFYTANNTSVMIDRESIPVIKDGLHGDGIKTITRTYARSAQSTTANDSTAPTIEGSWSASSPEVTEAFPYLWVKEVVTYKYQASTTKYYMLGARGDNGIDAQDIEFVYVRTEQPIAPTIVAESGDGYKSDDYLPLAKVSRGRINGDSTGNENTNVRCTDDPQGVNEEWKYEWEIKREKGAATNGHRQWTAYSGTMTLHNNFAESAFIIDIDNDNDQFGTDSESSVLVEQKRSTNVFMYYGTEKQTLNANNASPKGVTAVLKYSDDDSAVPSSVAVVSCSRDTNDKTKGLVEVTIKQGTFANEGMYALITANCARGSKTARFTLEKVKSGKKGENPVIYQLELSQKSFSYGRDESNNLVANSNSVTVNLKVTEGNESTIYTSSNIAQLANAPKFSWGYDSSATAQASEQTIGTTVTIAAASVGTHKNVWFLLTTGDKEEVPIVKDGTHGDGIKSITRTYAISAYNAPDSQSQAWPTDIDITDWKTTTDAVTEQMPYLWCKEVVTFKYRATADERYYYIGKRGDNGVDAQDIEFVYVRTTDNVAPTIVAEDGDGYKSDDYLPYAKVTSGRIKGYDDSGNDIEGNANVNVRCTDDPQGVDSTWRYEWEIKREKGAADGNGHRQWVAYSGKMKLHNNFAESTFAIDIDNDNDQFGTDSESRVLVQQTRVTNVSFLYGTEDMVFSETPKATLYYDSGAKLNSSDLANVASVDVQAVANTNGKQYAVTVTIKKTPDNATTMPLAIHNGLYVIIEGKCVKGTKFIRFTLEKLMSGEKGKSPTIYQLALSQKSLSYGRTASNNLEAKNNKVKVNVKKTYLDANGNYTSDIISSAMTTDGVTYSWGYDTESAASNDHKNLAIGTEIEVVAANVGTHKNIWILLSKGDKEEVPIVVDGAHGDNAVRIDLDNENDSFLYTSGGAKVPDTFKVTSQARLYDGSEDKSNQTTWTVTPEGCTLESQATSPNIVVSDMTAETGKVTVQGKYTDAHGNTHIKTAILTLKKLVDVDKYDLVIEPNAIAYNATTDSPATSTINISVYKMTVKGERTLSALPSGYKVYAGASKATATSTEGKYTATTDNSEISELLVKIAKSASSTDILDAETIPINKAYNGANAEIPAYLFIWKEDSVTSVTAPTVSAANYMSGTNLGGWSKQAPNQTAQGKHLWLSQNTVVKAVDGTYSFVYNTWSTPIRISGDKGDAGVDSSDREFIYKRLTVYPFPTTETSPASIKKDINGTTRTDEYIATTDNFVPQGWSNNALPATENENYVYCAIRVKSAGNNQQWAAFGEPFLWSNWGVQGTDGDGVQYLYKLFESELTPAECDLEANKPFQPTFNDTTKEWECRGWDDDPKAPTARKPYCYCSVIRKLNGSWGSFGTLGLWSRYSKDGQNAIRLDIDNESDMVQTDSEGKIMSARTIETVVHLYDGSTEVDISAATISTSGGPVTSGSDKIADFTSSAEPNSGKGKKLSWAFIAGKTMSDTYSIGISYTYGSVTYKAVLTIVASKGSAILQLKPSHSALMCSRDSNNTIGNPSALSLKVVKIDGSSSEEKDATSTNLTSLGVSVRYSTSEMPTSKTSGSNWAELNPANSFQATPSNTNVFIAMFNSSNVLLDRETIPVVKDGTNGIDGTSPYFVDLDDEMDSVACTSNGNVTTPYGKTINVRLWHGSTKMSLKDILIKDASGNPVTSIGNVSVSKNVQNGTVTFSVINGKQIAQKTEFFIIPTATGAPNNISAHFVLNGVRAGEDGTSPTIYQLVLNISEIVKKKNNSYSPDGETYIKGHALKIEGSNITYLNRGNIKYKLNGGEEEYINGFDLSTLEFNTGVQVKDVTSSIEIIFRVNDVIVDRETIPVVTDGNDADVWTIGSDGYWYKNGIKYTDTNHPNGIIAEGKNGTGVQIKGSVQNESDLPTQGVEIGDCWIVNSNRHLYSWTGNRWNDLGVFKGEPGTSSYMHIAYADSVTITNGVPTACSGFSMVKAKDSYPWVGLCVNDSDRDPDEYTAYEWNYVKGENGENAVRIDLDNQADLISLDSDGKVRFAKTVTVHARIYDGATQATEGVTNTTTDSLVIGDCTPNPSLSNDGILTISWAFTKGMSASSAVKVIKLTYGGIQYNAVFTIGTTDADEIYQVMPTPTKVSFSLNGSNQLTPPSQTLKCGYTRSNGSGTESVEEANVTSGQIGSTGLYIYYRSRSTNAWGSWTAYTTAGISVANTTTVQDYEFCISKGELNNDGSNIIDRECVPVVKDGKNGTSPIFADITNEMDSVSCTKDGKAISEQEVETTVSLWKGSTKQTLDSIAVTIDGTTIESTYATSGIGYYYKVSKYKLQGIVRLTIRKDAEITTRKEVVITVSDGTNQRDLILTINGARQGENGEDAVIYSLLPSCNEIVKKKTGTIPSTTSRITCAVKKRVGNAELTDAASTEYTLKYIKNNDGTLHDYPSNGVLVSEISTNLVFVLYDKATTPNVIDRETIPLVTDGTDGTSPYVADLDNEMDSVACNANGQTSSAQSVSTNISLNHGSSLVGFKTAVYDTDANGNAYTSGTKVNGITVSWNNVSTESTHDTVKVDFDNATSVSKKVFCIQISNSASGEERELYFTVNGIKPGANGSSPTIYNLKPSKSQISVGRTADGGYNPSTATLTCGYIKTTGNSSANEISDVTGIIDNLYYLYFRMRNRSEQNYGNYLLYSANKGSLSGFSVSTCDSVEFILCTADSSSVASGNLGTVIDKETVPIVCDGKSAVRRWLEISPSSVRVDSNSKLLSQLSYGIIYVEAWVQEGNNAPRKLTDEENATANIEVDGYIELADGECPIDGRVSIRDMYFSYDSTYKRFVFNGAGAEHHTSPLPKGTYFNHLDFYFEEDHKQVQLFVRGEKFKYEDFTQAELAELKGPVGPVGPDGDDAVTYTVSLDGSVFRYDSNKITSNIIAKVYRTVGSTTSQVTTGISKSDFKLFVLYTNGTQAEINANKYDFSNGEITSDYLNENGISGEDAIIVVFKNYWKATIHLTKDGENGGEGAQGYGIKITLTRNNISESNWKSIGENQSFAKQSGDPDFTDCRVNDYFIVAGEAPDTLIFHEATFRCTYTSQNRIVGTCISHTKDGSKGSRGLSIRGPRNWRKLLSTSGADLNFYQGADGEDFLDIVSFNPTDETEQNGDDHLYMCQQSYEATTSSTNPEDDTTHWKKADEYDFVATKLLYAVWAKIKQLETEMLKIKTSADESVGTVVTMNPESPFEVKYNGHKCFEVAVDPDTHHAYLSFYDENGFIGRIDSKVFTPVGGAQSTWSEVKLAEFGSLPSWANLSNITSGTKFYKFTEGYSYVGGQRKYNISGTGTPDSDYNERLYYGNTMSGFVPSASKVTSNGWFAKINNGVHPMDIDTGLYSETIYQYTNGAISRVAIVYSDNRVVYVNN